MGKQGSSSGVPGPLVFLLRGDWYVVELLELQEVWERCLRGSSGKA